MTELIALRFLADVNPTTPAFGVYPSHQAVTFMPLENVWSDDRLITSSSRIKAEVATGYVKFQRGDILCPKVTPTFQAGRSALLSELPCAVGAATTEVHVLRPRPGVDPRYVRYGLLSKRFLDEGVSRFQGVAGLQRVPEETVKQFKVARLKLEEQRRISDLLDAQITLIGQAVRHRQRQIALAAARGQGSLEAATKGRGGQVRLKYLVREVALRVGREPDPAELLSVSIHLGVVPRAEITDAPPRADSLAKYKRVRPGDIVLNRMRAFQGAVGVASTPGVVSPDYAVLRPLSGEVSSRYLNHLFRAPWFVAEMTARLRGIGGTEQGAVRTPRVNVDDLLDTVVPLPDRIVQDGVAAELDETLEVLGSTQRALAESISLLDERKRALITAAVSGSPSAADGLGGQSLQEGDT